MKQQLPTPAAAVPDATDYAEERIPFDQVLRKLVSAKPAHKAVPAPVKRNAKKPPKKANDGR